MISGLDYLSLRVFPNFLLPPVRCGMFLTSEAFVCGNNNEHVMLRKFLGIGHDSFSLVHLKLREEMRFCFLRGSCSSSTTWVSSFKSLWSLSVGLFSVHVFLH